SKNEYEQMLNHLMNRSDKPRSEMDLKTQLSEIETEKENNLAFNVVFQRAYIEAFWQFQKLSPPVHDGDEVESADELFEGDEKDETEGSSEPEPVSTSSVSEDDSVLARTQHVAAQVELFLEATNRLESADSQWLQHTFSVGTGAARK